MLSAFYPVDPHTQCSTQIVPYMPPATAHIQDAYYAPYGLPNGSFEHLQLSLCKLSHSAHTTTHPLLLFSPGLGNSRLIYSALAQSIASHGYTVITIDHPHDANVVEYPDGTLIFGANITTLAQIEEALRIRVQDVRFVLDQLSQRDVASVLIPTIHAPLNTSSVLIAGHSLGGATAAEAMLVDDRLVGGVDLDGTLFGEVVTKGLGKHRPFVLFGHEGKNQTTDSTWEEIWGRLKGWKRELELLGSQVCTSRGNELWDLY
jgi:pimeloyl-ACP methyl ester carboxylesterase